MTVEIPMKASFLKGNGVLPQDKKILRCLNNVIPTFFQCLGAKRPSLALLVLSRLLYQKKTAKIMYIQEPILGGAT